MTSVPVDVLPPPPIKHGSGQHPQVGALCSGQWNLFQKMNNGTRLKLTFVNPARQKKWTCIELVSARHARDENRTIPFSHMLAQAMQDYGMTEMSFHQCLQDDGTPVLRWEDEKFAPQKLDVDKAKEQTQVIEKPFGLVKKSGVQLLVLLLPSDDANLYSAIKRIGDHELGLLNVCHRMSFHHIHQKGADEKGAVFGPTTIDPRKKGDFLANLCMKINLKLDTKTVNQALDGLAPQSAPLSNQPTKEDQTQHPAVLGQTSEPQELHAPSKRNLGTPGAAARAPITPMPAHEATAGADVHGQYPRPTVLKKDDAAIAPARGAPAGDDTEQLPPLPSILMAEHTMIVGIDVTHPGSSARFQSPSIAAMVASTNAEYSQWPASLRSNPFVKKHDKKQAKEEIMVLKDMIYDRLLHYYEANNSTPPKRIIIYRDGISESQFDMCQTKEYPRIQAGISKFWRKKELEVEEPLVTLICAIKRHHTRLSPVPDPEAGATTSSDRSILISDENPNPVPGCLVQDLITTGVYEDFFLVNQKAIQGTAIPTHYVILENPSNHTTTDVAKMVSHFPKLIFPNYPSL